MWKEIVTIKAPYHFDAVLDRLSLDPLQAVDISARTVKVPIYIDSLPYVIVVQASGSIDEPSFKVSGSNNEIKDKALARIYEIFHWNRPLQNIHDHFASTKLQQLFDIHRGTALLLEFDYFGNILKSIIHQQLNLKFAFVLTERFVKKYGFEMEDTWFYPRPKKVAQLSVEELRELQFSGRKAEYIIGLANDIVEGRLDLESLSDKSNDEVIETLTKVRGIGRWTAESFLMFALGRQNIFPKADIGIQNALKQLLQLQDKPSVNEMTVFSEEWEPYLSYASLYLWRSIEKRSEAK